VRAVSGFDVELGDYRPHWRDIGLILDVNSLILHRPLTVRAGFQGNINDLVDALRQRPMGRRMAIGTARLFGFRDSLAAAKRIRLPMLAALRFVELAAQVLELPMQLGNQGLQSRNAAIAFEAPRAWKETVHDGASIAR